MLFFRMYQTFARFSGRGLQKFIWYFGLILNHNALDHVVLDKIEDKMVQRILHP